MSVVAALIAGGSIGVRHALEADHLAAVGTLVEDENSRTGLVGASWAIGHSIPITVLGLAFLVLGITLPEAVTGAFEALVGLVLVALGTQTLAAVFGVAGVGTHAHGGALHTHRRIGAVSFGTHQHVEGGSFLVGVIHGFAGSGAFVVALVAAAPTVDAALAFLGAFCVLTMCTMAGVSVLWERALETGHGGRLRTLAAVAGILVGGALLAERLLGVVVL